MKKLLCGLLLVSSVMLYACGGSGTETLLNPTPAPDAGATLSNPTLQAGLPAIDSLDQDPGRMTSVVGPGWYRLDLLNRSFGGNEQGVSDDDPAIDIAGAGSNGYCVFGVHGFDGDNYPTGLRTDVSSVNGEYFLAHTNYVTGRWDTAGPFTDSTTYEYPEVSQYSNPDNFVSKYTNHFVAIIVPDGSDLQLDMLQLGVDGGDVGPEAVPQMYDRSSEAHLSMVWLHSASYLDPDFAGYSVSRAPFPAGAFVKLTEENIFDTYFNDADAELDKAYLYRVTTWDTSGNSADSFAFPGHRETGATTEPVCVVNMPNGPLTGPVQVHFDLSDSFDNDGDAFTDYEFDLGQGLGKTNQLNPELDVTLQPGCYSLRFTVTAGGNTDYQYRQLKVYPQWESASNLIDAGTPLVYRNFAPRSFYDPASEKAVFLYADSTVPSLVSLTVDSSGNIGRYDMMHPFDDPQLLCSEPQLVNGIWTFFVANSTRLFSCQWHDNEIVPLYQIGANTDSATTAMFTDSNNDTWAVYQKLNIGFDIVATNLSTFQEVILIPGLISGKFFDAEWNPDADALDLVYSGSGSTDWLRWSPVVGPASSAVVNAADSEFVDIELDPTTGRPAVLLHNGVSILYSELKDDNSSWEIAGKVDPVDPDWVQSNLVFRDGNAYCYIGDNPGDSKLYRRNGLNWDVVNTADFADGGLFCNMTYIPSLPGFIVFDIAGDWATRITLMQEDGSESQLQLEEGWAHYGLELSAASSATEIHLLHKPLTNYAHWTSPDGVAWTETTDAGLGFGGKIVGDQNGEIYTSLINGGNTYLRHWVDPAWVDVEINPISNGSLPIIYGQGHALVFGNFNGDAFPDEFHYKRNLDAAFTFPTESDAIWDGAFAGAGTHEAKLLIRFGGVNFDEGDFGLMDTGGQIDYLFDPSFQFFDDAWAQGRHMEGAFYRNIYGSAREVFYVAYGPMSGPVRVWRNPEGEFQYANFDAVWPEIDLVDYRRTVSAMTAWGDTAVGIGNNYNGHTLFFEWDNFGDFEELPLPAALLNETASHHELVVGPDGRWHIIYRDYANDDLRIISTVN